jgi:hypothetical protein
LAHRLFPVEQIGNTMLPSDAIAQSWPLSCSPTLDKE